MQKEIAEQQAAEREVLNKIKEKMERIKASQQLVQNQQIREPASHYEGESRPVPWPCGSGCVQSSAALWYFLCGVKSSLHSSLIKLSSGHFLIKRTDCH